MRNSLQGLTAEVWVVDNASNDGSLPFLQPLFPEVFFIESKENLGFAKANNLALQQAKGNFILYLNPDTLLPENCLHACLSFFKVKPDAGAIGIRMVDGSGTFLRESKRAFPSPLTSFFKLVGLSVIFPTSPIFARYQLGHLSCTETHVVDVLAGAFMMMRRDVVEKTGGFDERFFMYGEDIDLSYRIQKTLMPNGKSHWQNYYFAGSSIVHFKGESTKKGSLNYVKLFYKAMGQFVEKHYASGAAKLFSILLYAGIMVRAFFSLIYRFIQKLPSISGLRQSADRKGVINENKDMDACRQTLVAGTMDDYRTIEKILTAHSFQNHLTGRLSAHIGDKENALMPLTDWIKNLQDYPATDLIFCMSSNLTMEQIMPMLKRHKGLCYKFHYAGSSSIVSSDDSNLAGEVVSM